MHLPIVRRVECLSRTERGLLLMKLSKSPAKRGLIGFKGNQVVLLLLDNQFDRFFWVCRASRVKMIGAPDNAAIDCLTTSISVVC